MVTAGLEESTREPLSCLIVAMDGPAGSGKSTASRGLAEALSLRYLDSGAMYRAMTWWMLLDGVDVTDAASVASRADRPAIEVGTDPAAPTIDLDGNDVSRQIRSDEVNAAVSAVSAVPRVREVLVAQQRALIGSGGIVVEGRDIGTVVAPAAQLKVYLTADPSARASRRTAEMALDSAVDLRSVESELLRRDVHDSSRAVSPLCRAADAVELDTTHLSLAEVVSRLVSLALERAGATR